MSPVERLSHLIAELFPGRLSADVKKNLDATVRAAFARMDLVTREELEVHEAVLIRTRQKLEALEAQLAELENSKN